MQPRKHALSYIRVVASCAYLLTASQLLHSAPSYGATRPPERLRIRVQSVLWWSNGIGGGKTESTDYFDAAPRDDIDGSRAYPGWQSFGPGSPFRLGRIVDEEHAWVHFSGGIHPAKGSNEPSSVDSIIVSTVDRSFTSGSMDAGLEFNLRIEPASPLDAMGTSNGMQLIHRRPVVPGPEGFRDHVESVEAIGIFRILAIKPGRDSVRIYKGSIGTTEMEVVPRDLWRHGPLALGKTITLVQERPPVSDTSWAAIPQSTPMRRGDDVILFLVRGRTAPFTNRWTFSSFKGYGLLANQGNLVFSSFGRGVRIEKFRNDVRLCEQMRFHAGRGALMGRVLHAGSSVPITGALVRVEGSKAVSQSASDGWFELFDLPIGQRRLSVKDSLGEVSALVEITDEKVDSLEVRVAQPGDPGPAARSPETILAESRATGSLEGYLHIYDVTPMPYKRSEPRYPEDARKSNFEGDVVVRARIDSLGRLLVASAEGNVSPDILTEAEACVRRWRFRPGLKDGRPVGCWVGLPVHFAHPASNNLAAREDRTSRSTASFTRDSGTTQANLVVEGSATLDSVTMTYRYYYRIRNSAGSTRDLVAFALMPAEPADMNLDHPEGWNGFLGCGGRRDVVGWMVWGDAPRHDSMMDFAIAPGQELAGIGFTSKRPPRRIRWFANTMARGERDKLIWDCSSSATETMLKTPLQGTIVGPGSGRDPQE
jgi:TonB family protein